MLASMPPANNACQAYAEQSIPLVCAGADATGMNEDQSSLKRRALGAAIRTARNARNLTQSYVAKKVAEALQSETNQGNISKIEKGEVGVSQEMLYAISDAVDLPLSKIYQLAEDTGEYHALQDNRPSPPQPGMRMVPLVSWVQAGRPTEIADAYTRKSPDSWVATGARVGRDAYALQVKGRSMTNPSPAGPTFPEGSIIIVDPSREWVHGSLIVARIDDDDEATFKRVEIDGGDKFLVPLNPAFPTVKIEESVTFLGVVVSKAEEPVQ